MIKYEYMTDDEINNFLLKEGDGDFRVRKVSMLDRNGNPLKDKSGADMFLMTLDVTDSNRKALEISCYISAGRKAIWKFKQLLDSVGLSHRFNQSGAFNESELIGKSGKCKIITEPARDGYKARSAVAEFIPFVSDNEKNLNGLYNAQKHEPVQQEFVEDDIPF